MCYFSFFFFDRCRFSVNVSSSILQRVLLCLCVWLLVVVAVVGTTVLLFCFYEMIDESVFGLPVFRYWSLSSSLLLGVGKQRKMNEASLVVRLFSEKIGELAFDYG